MAGLLDFAATPEGQGLLAAAFGGLAGAKRGAPINTLGIAGLSGLTGYGAAQGRAQDQEKYALEKQQRDLALQRQKEQQAWLDSQDPMKRVTMGAMQNGQAQTADNAANIPPVDPREVEMWQMAKSGVLPLGDFIKAKGYGPKEYKTVGTSLVDVSGAQPKEVFTAAEKKTDIERQLDAAGITDPAARQRYITAGIVKQTTHAPGATTKIFNSTKDDFKNERDLRNDFATLPTTKAFNEVQSAHDQIKVGLGKQSPAGDLAAATKLMKILDPGSVVRESELAMAMQASGALDRLSNYGNMVITGQKLTPTQRKDFGELSDQLYSTAADRYDQSADEYRSTAADYKLNQDRVAKPATRQQPTTQAAPAKPPMKGQVVDGYKFNGGNPADPKSWTKQ